MANKILFFVLLLTAAAKIGAEESYSYQKPKSSDFITSLPKNYWNFLDSSLPSSANQNLKGWGAVIFSMGVFLVFDEEILNNIQKAGREIGFGNKEVTRKTLTIGDDSLMNAPTDFPSALFFLGDGWTSIGLTSAFLTSGLISQDPRTLQTATQLFQGLLLTGVSTQIIKRAAGRETPNSKTSPGGSWRPFPKTKDYQNAKSGYDSYPSAHLATAMTSFTIISENYPKYFFIKPLGYTILAIVSFQAVNYGYHWASDFPLSVAMGHMLGKTLVDSGRITRNNQTNSRLLPILRPDGRMGASLEINY